MTLSQPEQRIDIRKFDLITFEVEVGFAKPTLARTASTAAASSAFLSLFRMKHGPGTYRPARRLAGRMESVPATAWTAERRGCLTRPELRPM